MSHHSQIALTPFTPTTSHVQPMQTIIQGIPFKMSAIASCSAVIVIPPKQSVSFQTITPQLNQHMRER